MIDGQKFFDQSVKNDLRTYGNNWKTEAGQGDYYTTGCLICYYYFEECYETLATDLNKQRALDAYAKAIQQINFAGNLDWDGNTTMFFIIDESKETILVNNINQKPTIMKNEDVKCFCLFHLKSKI